MPIPDPRAHDIGEAVNQLTTKFPDYRHRITGRSSIIGSRNAMAHRLSHEGTIRQIRTGHDHEQDAALRAAQRDATAAAEEGRVTCRHPYRGCWCEHV